MWVVVDVIDAVIRVLFQKGRMTDRLAIANILVVVFLALTAFFGVHLLLRMLLLLLRLSGVECMVGGSPVDSASSG